MTPPDGPNAGPIVRLTKRAQFLYVRGGAKAVRETVIIEARRRQPAEGAVGVGFTASKKVGNAVARNRSRRRLREAAKRLLPSLGLPGADYVLVARQTTPDAPWARLLDDVQNALLRLAAELEGRAAPPRRAPRPKP
ncbi:MAG: ribonuclease P protein component [Hyphomonadaceae bacterium]|nr:ribonuclease P protein component [Hyphomonadaceae bacterium]